MKNLKKVLALLLAAMMVMGLLSACTKTEEPATQPTEQSQEQATTEESKTDAAAQTTEEPRTEDPPTQQSPE